MVRHFDTIMNSTRKIPYENQLGAPTSRRHGCLTKPTGTSALPQTGQTILFHQQRVQFFAFCILAPPLSWTISLHHWHTVVGTTNETLPRPVRDAT